MQTKYIDGYISRLKEMFSKSTAKVLFVLLFVILGVVVGVVLSLGDIAFIKILYNQQETISYYVSGTANVSEIFFSRFFIYLFAMILVFVFCLNYYTSCLSVIYICYQTTISTIAILSLCDYHGIAGILLSIFFAIPINLLLIFLLSAEYIICFNRAKNCHAYRTKFTHSFDSDFWITISVLLIFALVLHIVANLVFPLIFRGIFIINY